MSLSLYVSPIKFAEWLTISADHCSNQLDNNQDFFVGTNVKLSLTLMNGTESRINDLVVLGKLHIAAKDPNDLENRPVLKANNIIVVGELLLDHVCSESTFMHIAKNRTEFIKEIQKNFLEWLSFQKESAEKMGLRSIFPLTYL